MCPITVSCNECTYVQKNKNANAKKVDPPVYYEQTFKVPGEKKMEFVKNS